MGTLEELLQKEAEAYMPWATLMRMSAIHVRGLDKIPIKDLELKMHLEACEDYFARFGTISGENTPWIVGGEKYGKEEE